MATIYQEIIPRCRICYETDIVNMIKPCECAAVVHRGCLNNWRKTIPIFSATNLRSERCEVCCVNYQFEGRKESVVPSKLLVARDCIITIFFLQIVGFLLGIFMTGFGEVTTMIAIKHINIYLYQYIIGNALIHIILGLIAIISLYNEKNTHNNNTDTPDNFYFTNVDCNGEDCLSCCVVLFVCSFFIVAISIYVLAIERSKQRQKARKDFRKVKDLGGYSLNYVV